MAREEEDAGAAGIVAEVASVVVVRHVAEVASVVVVQAEDEAGEVSEMEIPPFIRRQMD